MSKKSKNSILETLLFLIYQLEEADLIDIGELARALKVVEKDTCVLRFSGNVNYKIVADYLKKFGSIFLRISRKRALYAERRLEELCKRTVVRIKVKMEEENGYLFMFKDTHEEAMRELA